MNLKGSGNKPEAPRSRDSSEVEVMASKRHGDRTSSSREKAEYEPPAIKRSKASGMKDVHEIIDDRDGGRMQLMRFEQRALQQQLKLKMDALKYVFSHVSKSQFYVRNFICSCTQGHFLEFYLTNTFAEKQ